MNYIIIILKMEQCIGIKTGGDKCTTMCVDTQRCKIHQKTVETYGPNTTRRKELMYQHHRKIRDLQTERTLNGVPRDQHLANVRLETIDYHLKLHALETIIATETAANGGVDKDLFYIGRRNRLIHERWERRRHLQEMWQERRERLRAEHNLRQINLAQIAHDRQNIHTTVVVQKVKVMVEKILQIPVPPEYDSLKTPGEIIMECQLSKQAAKQMMNKYCEEVDIYELGIGIYAKVLNAVWQYIKTSEHSADLKKILATEMQDNIDMCQQGNLTRLCNILSGYIDIEIPRSPLEILGEKFSKLQGTGDMSEAEDLLREFNIPQEEWEDWMETV
jgi:hypothetical protein